MITIDKIKNTLKDIGNNEEKFIHEAAELLGADLLHKIFTYNIKEKALRREIFADNAAAYELANFTNLSHTILQMLTDITELKKETTNINNINVEKWKNILETTLELTGEISCQLLNFLATKNKDKI